MNSNDLDAFRAQFTDFDEPAAADTEPSVVTQLPSILKASEWLADGPEETPPAIVKGVLHKCEKMVIGGSSKAGKSWLLLNLAIAVATGTPWLKYGTSGGKVLYINFEISAPYFGQRVAKVVNTHKLHISGCQNLHIWNLRGHAASLDLLVPRMVEEAKGEAYDLIIIDPIYKSLGGADENRASDISAMCNQVDRLANESGAAIAYVAHYTKGNQAGKEAIDRISGSGVYTRDADVIINLTQHQDPACLSVDVVLRNLPPTEPFVVRREFPIYTVQTDLDPAHLKTRVRSNADSHAAIETVYKCIPLNSTIDQKRLALALERSGISRKKISDAVAVLIEQQRVERVQLPRKGAKPAIGYRRILAPGERGDDATQ